MKVSVILVRFPNPLVTGHSWQLGNLTSVILAFPALPEVFSSAFLRYFSPVLSSSAFLQYFSLVLFFCAFLQCTVDNRYSQYTTLSCTYPVQCFSPVCTVDNRYSAICKHRARIVSSVFSSAFLPTVDNRYTVYVSCPVFALLQCCQG